MKAIASKTGRYDYTVGDSLETREATYTLLQVDSELWVVQYQEDGGLNDDNWEFDNELDAETCFVDGVSRLRDVVTDWDFI